GYAVAGNNAPFSVGDDLVLRLDAGGTVEQACSLIRNTPATATDTTASQVPSSATVANPAAAAANATGATVDSNATVSLQCVSSTTLHVGSIQAGYHPSGNSYRVGVGILVQDQSGQPVAQARITLAGRLPDGTMDHTAIESNSQGHARLSFVTQQT